MFTVKCIADDGDFEMAFVPKQDAISSAETWMSTDGTIVVQAGAFGGWKAYQYPSWKALNTIPYGNKEEAAVAACKAWVN